MSAVNIVVVLFLFIMRMLKMTLDRCAWNKNTVVSSILTNLIQHFVFIVFSDCILNVLFVVAFIGLLFWPLRMLNMSLRVDSIDH